MNKSGYYPENEQPCHWIRKLINLLLLAGVGGSGQISGLTSMWTWLIFVVFLCASILSAVGTGNPGVENWPFCCWFVPWSDDKQLPMMTTRACNLCPSQRVKIKHLPTRMAIGQSKSLSHLERYKMWYVHDVKKHLSQGSNLIPAVYHFHSTHHSHKFATSPVYHPTHDINWNMKLVATYPFVEKKGYRAWSLLFSSTCPIGWGMLNFTCPTPVRMFFQKLDGAKSRCTIC